MTSNLHEKTGTSSKLSENQSKNSVLLQGNKPVVVPFKAQKSLPDDNSLRIKIKEPTSEENPDNIFYNIDIVNRNSDLRPIPAVYDILRTDSILENPSLYNVTVARFEIPTSIPLFIFPEPSNYQYFIALEDHTDPLNVITSKFPVVYINYVQADFLSAYPRGVYYVGHMLRMVNITLQTCYDNMKLINPAYLPTQAPFLTYDAATTLITLWSDAEYLDIERYRILFSNVLYTLGFPSILSRAIFIDIGSAQGRTPIQLLVEDQYINSETVNGTLLYKTVGEFSTLQLFNQLQQILVETDSMNIDGEIQSGTLPNVRRLLTDFEPPADISNRQYYTYNPSIYRWYNLLSTTPMNRISCRIFVSYSSGDTFPLLLLFNELSSIKLLFKLKENL